MRLYPSSLKPETVSLVWWRGNCVQLWWTRDRWFSLIEPLCSLVIVNLWYETLTRCIYFGFY